MFSNVLNENIITPADLLSGSSAWALALELVSTDTGSALELMSIDSGSAWSW